MSVSCNMLRHCNSSCSISKGHFVQHFIHNDYTRWISENEFLWNFKQKLFTTRQAVSEERDSEARSRNYSCRGDPITITYSWCVSVALVTQHAKRVCRIILLSATCPALLNISTLSHKWHDFRGKKVTEHKMCVLIFLLSETFVIIRRHKRGIIINVHRSSCKVPLLLPDFHETWIFSTDCQKIIKYQISWKPVQWKPSCYMRPGWHAAKQIAAFRNSTKSDQKKCAAIRKRESAN